MRLAQVLLYTIVYTKAYCYRQNKSLHIVRHELKLLRDLKPTFLLCYCSARRIPEEIIWKISTQKKKTREKDLISTCKYSASCCEAVP